MKHFYAVLKAYKIAVYPFWMLSILFILSSFVPYHSENFGLGNPESISAATVLDVKAPRDEETLFFNRETLSFNALVGADISPQMVTLSASSGNPSITLSEDPDASSWLILPEASGLGNLQFAIKAGLPAGSYATTLFAAATTGDYANAQLNIVVEITEPFSAQINFQDRTTTPPAGYLKDYGKQFGYSSVAVGEKNYSYGWKLLANGLPFDASDQAANNSNGVGRNRLSVTAYANAPDQEKLEGTLVHFQGNNILTDALQLAWEGQPRVNELFWEMEVPNGIYDVTIGLGDQGADIDSRHSATVEGYTVVPAFVPVPNENRNAMITVVVTDGLLTVNGQGGFNSKINYIKVRPGTGTPASEALTFDPTPINVELLPDATGALTSSLKGSADGVIGLVIANNITNRDAKNNTGKTDWLTIPATASMGQQEFIINAAGLRIGNTRGNKIIASAKGYRPAVLNAGLTVVEESKGMLQFAPERLSINAPSGTSQNITLNLTNSNEDPVTLTLLADDAGNVPSWLTYNGQVLSEENQVQHSLGDGSGVVLFNIDASTLEAGAYAARVTASLAGYQTAVLDITLYVDSERIVLNVEKITGDAITSGNNTFTKDVEITNNGEETLSGITAQIRGTNAADFTFTGLPASLDPHTKAVFSVIFDPSANGVRSASLSISAVDASVKTIPLNGLGKTGTGGNNEPSLQDVLDTYFGVGQINTTDTDPSTNQLDLPSGKSYNDVLGDELDIKSFKQVTDSPVTIEVLSVFGPEDNDPVNAFGWYKTADASSVQEIFTVSNSTPGNGQTLNPLTTGSLAFNPGSSSFGFYSRWPYFNNRTLFSEDALNTFANAVPHHVRVYAVPGEENAYVIATEEHISGFDYQDIVVIVRNVKPAMATGEGCNPISTLACDALEVTLPFALDFTGSEGGLAQTGFTMVDNPSSRITIDGSVSNPAVVGFEPGRISFANGKMILNAANGIAYIKNGSGTGTSTDVNSQINTLGVGVNANAYKNFSISTKVVNPYKDASQNSEQAGLWFGLDEDNYVKLAAINDNSIQLLTEINAVADETDNTVRAANIANLHTSTVSLRLYVDQENKLLTGYYSLNGGAEVEVGSLPLPDTFISGNAAYDNLSFAGVFATKRREFNAAVNYTFDDFAIITDDTPVATNAININFSDPVTQAPADYVRDAGAPFGERADGHSYGWLDAKTGDPADLSLNGRKRTVSGVDILGSTLIHMQYGNIATDASKGYLPDAKWEIALPQGIYRVSVTVGDPAVDSKSADIPKHTINAEGISLINQFIPTGTATESTRFKTASGEIEVFDGRLTIDATGGFNTKISSLNITPVSGQRTAYFVNSTPKNNATNVALNDFQTNVELVVPDGYELDKTTLAGHVNLYEVTAQGDVLVPSNANDTGGGDAITLTPLSPVKEFTTYVFRLAQGIEANRIGDLNDKIAFKTYESRFTTGSEIVVPPPVRDLSGVEFSQIKGATLGDHTTNELFSSLTIGPDGKLYASTLGDFASDGKIQRWDINADGTLSNVQILSPELTGSPFPVTGATRNNQNRLIIGLTFDPASTADNLIAYVTHSMASVTNGPEWDGKLTRLSGPDLSEVQDLVIHLPRSAKDHLTNSITFDPQGVMYINQGSNSAGGKPDSAWNLRTERLLSASVLKVELNKLPAVLPLDAYTTSDISVINNAPTGSIVMSDGTYNPYAVNSPVTIFATGIRNAYDLVWHSNGWLYIPTNGTAGNNYNSPNTPSTKDYQLARRIDGRTDIGSITGIEGGETQKDWLFKTKGGSYHGHPNPYRGEYVLNHGGKPYSGLPGQAESSYRDVAKYPTTVGPDPNYREPAYDFGKNKSPNGVIEYKSDAFGGKLKGVLMVVRFSGQDDLLVMDPSSNGDIAEVYNNIPGLGGFDDPLDVVEDTRTGNIYISEYDRDQDGLPQLTLLRAKEQATTPVAILVDPEELIFEATNNSNEGDQTDTKTVEVKNTSTSMLKITGAKITGDFADQFELVNPQGAVDINPGESMLYTVTYAPEVNNNDLGYQNALLTITSNDADSPNLKIGLYALKKAGFEGDHEPKLQDVVDALGIGINVGWDTLANGTDPKPIGDEVEVERWVKISADLPIIVTPVGRYSPAEALPFGWYTHDGNVKTHEIGTLQNGLPHAQTLFPPLESEKSSVSFDPKGSIFGFYVESKSFNRFNYTEDVINTDGVAHRVRIYPNKDRNGIVIPYSYLIAFEDASNGDYQDYMFVISNVVPIEDAVLAFDFDPKSLEFEASVNQENIISQQVTLSATGGITPGETTLDASEDWVILPTSYKFGDPFDININTEGLGVGNHEAVITASADNYTTSELSVKINVTNELVYVYQFNFQSPEDIEVSPQDYIDDIGKPFGTQNTGLGSIDYGWVIPGTNTPADAGVNGRNRNNGSNDNALLKTFNIIGHRERADYPLRDWIVKLPNGSYSVNISVGEAAYVDSNHVLDVNGVTVVDFDQENNNPDKLVFSQGTKLVEVTDGTLRLSLNPRGVNAKINYIRIAPVNESLLQPSIAAVFDGLQFGENTYRGAINVSLSATDRSQSGSIALLEYRLDAAAAVAYSAPFTISTSGEHTLIVDAEDGYGNVASKTYNFTLQQATGALLFAENMTKIPGTNRSFPANDYYTFYTIGNPNTGGDAPTVAITHDKNTMRLNNTGTGTLIISEINISNPANYSYTIGSGSQDAVLPLSIAPGKFKDVVFKITAKTTNGRSALFKETVSIVSNADNNGETTATLNGGFAPKPENGIEISAQQVFNAFGFKSSMLSIVNDDGTITPRNSDPTRPHSNFPLAENIDAGYEGDLILSPAFVQADESKPVIGLQLSALHGKGGADNAKFLQVNGKGTVGGIDFRTSKDYYQTLLPNRGSQLNSDMATTISEPFRIAIADYLTTGGNNINGNRPDLLGARVYKAIDGDGNVIPNEYIVLQDFIQNGCGAGSANCDWNDNTFYFINIRPQAVPTALPIDDYAINLDETFTYDVSANFDKGYPGNKLTFSLSMVDGSEVPSWIKFDPITLRFSGKAPQGAKQSYSINISSTDLNGLKADSQVTFIVTDPSAFALRINAGGPTLNYLGKEFVKDIYFNGGAPYFNTKAPLPELHTSERSDAKTFGYEVPVPNGNYTVTLHFAEIYWGAVGGGPGGTGKRIFDVSLENSLILDNYDITADVGPQTPVAKSFEVNIQDGILNIEFSSETSKGGKDFPMLSGLEVINSNVNTAPNVVASANVTSGTSPLNVEFSGDASTDDKGIVSYQWNFGNGDTSTEMNPKYTFTKPGDYDVTLTVSDEAGLSATAKLNIKVNANNTKPLAVINGGPFSGDAPVFVEFIGSNSQDDKQVTAYAWSFGDGQTATEANPSHRYDIPGDYIVSLTVFDAEGLSDDVQVQVRVNHVNAAPIAIASSSVTRGTSPLSVNFDGTASSDDANSLSYSWKLDDAVISNEGVFDYVFNQPGSYNIELTVTDDKGLSDSDTVEIVVEVADPDPETDFALRINAGGPQISHEGKTFSADQYFKAGKTYNNALARVATLFQTERSASPPAFGYDIPVANGDYTVNLYFAEVYWGARGNEAGGVGKRIFDVKIENVLVLDNLDITKEVGAEKELVKSFNVTVADGRMNIDLSALANVGGVDQPKISGVEILGKNMGNKAPQAIVLATPVKGRAPLEVSFTGSNSTDDKGIANYLWTFKSGSTSVESDPKFTFAEAGNYQVALQVEDAEGLRSTANVTINVTAANTAPVAVASATPLTGTAPLLINFTGENSTDDTGIKSYVWTFGDGGTSSQMNPSHTYSEAGNYIVQLYVTDAEGLVSNTAELNIVIGNPEPTEEFAMYINAGSNADLPFEGKLFKGDVSMPSIYNRSYIYENKNASNIEFYQTERGTPADKLTLSYSIPVPNGTYKVNTYHNELYWGKLGPGGSGRRVFDILIEGKLVKDDLDLFKESGNQPTKLSFDVVVSDGVLNIDMPASVNRPSISGIAIEKMINHKPEAVATANPKIGTAPLVVNFDGTASIDDNQVTGYRWIFESGITSTEAKPTHTFNTAGTYPVTLIVTDAGGLTDEKTLTIEVREPAVQTDFAMYLNTGTASDVSFEGKTFVGDKKSPAIYDSNHTYVSTSASNIPLYQSERSSEADRGKLNFKIPVPNGTYTVSTYHNEVWWGKSPDAGKAGPAKRVFDIVVEGDLVKDDFDIFKESNNAPTKLSFNNITVTDGVLNINMAASIDRPSISGISIEGVTQNEAPVAVISATPKTGTAPLAVTFTGSGSTDDQGIINYFWDFNDGTTSTLANPNHTFTLAGSYDVSLKVTDVGGLSHVARTTITSLGCNPVPSPWIATDIGQVAATGNTCYTNGTFNVKASGADIWSLRDEFHFVYRQLTGDAEIIARVNNITNTSDWAKGGIMMRGSLDNNAQHAFMVIAPNPGNIGGPAYAMQSRNENGGSTASSSTTRITNSLPMYVRLVRNGNTFRGYVSATNGNWKLVGTKTINMGETMFVGLATTSHRDGVLTSAVYDQVSVTGSQANVLAAAPRAGQAPLTVDFNEAGKRSKTDASLRYFWDFQDGTSSTEKSPSHIFEKAGTYEVTVTVKEGKTELYTSSITINVDGLEPVSIWDQQELEPFALRLYPNPASGSVNLEVKGATHEVSSIEIYDLRGREVQRFEATRIKHGNNYPLDISNLQAGIYMLRISHKEGLLDQLRLVVKNN